MRIRDEMDFRQITSHLLESADDTETKGNELRKILEELIKQEIDYCRKYD